MDTELSLVFTTLLYQSSAVISHTSNTTAIYIFFNDQINEPLESIQPYPYMYTNFIFKLYTHILLVFSLANLDNFSVEKQCIIVGKERALICQLYLN